MMSSGSSGLLSGGSTEEAEIGWEMRPCGMLVQTRAADPGAPTAPEVRLRISHGNARYEVSISSEASFGELKKLLSMKTGLQPGEQKLLYKGKEKANREFLDACGIKIRSKIVLEADPLSMERRYVEMKKNAKIQSAQRTISAVSLEVNKLADQVSTIEKSITNGNMVAEVQITTLIELLMRQAVMLDGITTEGDTCPQKNLQVVMIGGDKKRGCKQNDVYTKLEQQKLGDKEVGTIGANMKPPGLEDVIQQEGNENKDFDEQLDFMVIEQGNEVGPAKVELDGVDNGGKLVIPSTKPDEPLGDFSFGDNSLRQGGASIWEMDGLQVNMEFNQIFITLLDGSTRCLQFPSPTVSGGVLKRHLSSFTGIPASVQCLITGSLNVHDDTHLSASAGFFPSCTLLLRLRAGKGGVRGASQKKTHNFVDCQDLSGRRI